MIEHLLSSLRQSSFRATLLIALLSLMQWSLEAQCTASSSTPGLIEAKSRSLNIVFGGFSQYTEPAPGELPKKYLAESLSGSYSWMSHTDFQYSGKGSVSYSGSWVFSSEDFSSSSSMTKTDTEESCQCSIWPCQTTVSGATGTTFYQANYDAHLNGAIDGGWTPVSMFSPGSNTLSATSITVSNPGLGISLQCPQGGPFGDDYLDVSSMTDYRGLNLSCSLSSEFTMGMAIARAEQHATIGNSRLAYTEVPAGTWYPPNSSQRTDAFGFRKQTVDFRVAVGVACRNEPVIIRYAYLRWPIGGTRPSDPTYEYESVTLPLDGPTQTGWKSIEAPEGWNVEIVGAEVVSNSCGALPGVGAAHNSSVDYVVSLGRDAGGHSFGSLSLYSATVNTSLYAPSGLRAVVHDQSILPVLDANGALRQIRAYECTGDIVTIDMSAYEIRFYRSSQVGVPDPVTGLATVSGDPFSTIRIQNPDAATGGSSRLEIIETRDGLAKATVFAQSGSAIAMSQGSGDATRVERVEKTTGGGGVTYLKRTVESSSGLVALVTKETMKAFPWGTCLIERSLDPDGVNLRTTETYYENAADGPNYGRLKLRTEPNGRWQRFEYDAEGRITKTVAGIGDDASTVGDAVALVTSTVFETIADVDGDLIDESLETIVTTYAGQETARSYRVKLSKLLPVGGHDTEVIWSIEAAAPGSSWNSPANLVRQSQRFVAGPRRGTSIMDRESNETLTLRSFVDSGGTTTTTVSAGESNATGDAVVSGTRTVTVTDGVGNLVSEDVYDIASGFQLSTTIVTETDTQGRATRIDRGDGSYEIRVYSCCGLESVTDSRDGTTSYTYDALGRQVTVTRAGRTVRTGYDAAGNVLNITRIGSDGSEIVTESHGYDRAARRLSSKDARNRTTSFATVIQASGRMVTTTTFPDLGTKIETYLRDGSLYSLSGTAAASMQMEYGVDADGRYTKQIRLGSSGEETEWSKSYVDFLGRSSKTVHADGATASRFYDAQGRLQREVDEDGVTRLLAYNARGELEVTAIDVDRDGTIDFDGLDRVTRTTGTYATAHGTTVRRVTTEVWDVDNTDSPRTVSVVESSVDGLRSWSSSAGLNSSSEVQLDGPGARTEISISPQQVRSERVFLNDRLQSATILGSDDQPVVSQTFTYDPHGRLHQQIDSRTGATTYTYFADDQVETITTPDPDAARSGPGYDPQVTTFAYDTAGRQSTVTQPDTTVVTQEFYPTSLVKKITGSRTYPQQFTYDAQGRIKTLTTWQDYAAGTGAAVTTWNYDSARGWLADTRHADNNGPSYTYWPSGRLKTRTWARGLVTTYGYTTAGDLQSVDYDDTTPDVTHTYDRFGHVRTTIDAAGTLTRTYTGLGQLDDETYSGTTAFAGQTIARTFDPMARLQSLTISAATPVAYGYDPASRLQTVTRGGSVATYGYVPASALLQSVTVQQGGATRLSAVKAYDMLGRLSSVVNTPSAAGVQSFAYDYNAANQRSRATREDGTYWEYGYDALGQVTGATKRLADGSAIVGAAHGFTFDDIGNRETATVNGRVSTYTPTALNQYAQRTIPSSVEVLGSAHPDATVTVNMEPATRQGERFVGTVAVDNAPAAVWAEARIVGVRNLQGPQGEDAITEETRRLLVPRTPEVFAYDLDGNLTGDGRWSYTWDGENRLVAMETPAALVDPAGPLPLAERRRLEFAYDAGGRRLSKKVYSWDGAVWTLATHRVFLYDGWNMAAEYRVAPDGVSLTFERSATWGLDLSGSMQGAGGVGGLLWSGDTTAAYAAAYDGNGNVTALIDTATGTISGDFEYGPFGESLKASGSAVAVSPFQFSTKFTDAETDLVYYGLRYYNPATGRWPSRDPLGERGGKNLYGMVGNNLVGLFDMLGLYPGLAGHGEIISPEDSVSLLARASAAADRKFDEILASMSTGGLSRIHGPDFAARYSTLRNQQRLVQIIPLGPISGGSNPSGLDTDMGNRFVYTCKYGWVDMGHFLRNAHGAYSLNARFTERAADLNERGQERVGSDSAWGVEDLSSNHLGRVFGAELYAADKAIILAHFSGGSSPTIVPASSFTSISGKWSSFLREAGAVKWGEGVEAFLRQDMADFAAMKPLPQARSIEEGLQFQKNRPLWKDCLCNGDKPKKEEWTY